MAQKSNALPLIIIAVVAVGAMVGLNLMNQKNDPGIQQVLQKEAEKEAAKKEAANATPPSRPNTSTPGANDVVTWGAEKTFGTPGGSGKPAVVLGWTWTPTVQANPSSIFNTLTAVQKAFPEATIQVINIDAKPGAATPGISVDGSMRVAPLTDGTFPSPEAIQASLTQPAQPAAK